jgi:hypothetical protein
MCRGVFARAGMTFVCFSGQGSSDHHVSRTTASNMRDVLGHLCRVWLTAAVVIPVRLKAKVAVLVRARLSRGSNDDSAEKLRLAIKRLTDAFTWGGVTEAD